MRLNTIYPTIQGEGCLTGTPMVLVRLQGCNLRCPFCDTKETWDRDGGEQVTPAEIVERVKSSTWGHRWVLLTGGEPALQDLGELTTLLHAAGYKIALETNGTLPLAGSFDWVCVSPKVKPLAEVLSAANEVKYIIKDRIPEPDFTGPVICLQPESQDRAATALCIRTVQERGWRLSLQFHKFLDIP